MIVIDATEEDSPFSGHICFRLCHYNKYLLLVSRFLCYMYIKMAKRTCRSLTLIQGWQNSIVISASIAYHACKTFAQCLIDPDSSKPVEVNGRQPPPS